MVALSGWLKAQADRVDEGIEESRRAVELMPQQRAGHDNPARVMMQGNRLEEAEKRFASEGEHPLEDHHWLRDEAKRVLGR